ncbi:uncharacterized protein LOC114849595 [Betta splendens]|uniref:Uncharacterized protein LOC114849595 n=1 Tax=Betta splendens TaxID=158456 RepID=A0A8M1HAD5_BETSP|nr:uncharacterized protein LOC114849595 [Betta splendens]
MKTSGPLLGVLCLSGCLIFSTCLLHKYHFININSTWTEAQTYCRTNYIDLATTDTIAEVNQLISTVSSAGYKSNVWIGIYVTVSASWTYDHASDYLTWTVPTESNTFFNTAWCGSMESNGMSWCENCTAAYPFICDHGNRKIFVNTPMDFLKAWSYCKENFTDLTTPINSSMNAWANNVMAMVPSVGRVWFGLLAFGSYHWSDLSAVSFKYWEEWPQMFAAAVLYGAADLQRLGTWSFLPAGSLPFVCYTEDIQVETKVLRLKVSSTTDVNDSALEANILSQLQKRFMEQGLSGAALKWRKQPDGKIFQKKENTDASDDHACPHNTY